jgi:hypothetical protein
VKFVHGIRRRAEVGVGLITQVNVYLQKGFRMIHQGHRFVCRWGLLHT